MDFRGKLFEYLNSGIVADYDLTFFSDELVKNKASIPLLYRYTGADYYNIRALEKKEIYLAEVGSMNDIFEGLSSVVDYRTINRIPDLHDIIYLKSFSENRENLLMWGTYADNYSGMCVEYDLRKMDEYPQYYYHLFPVCYSDSRLKNTWGSLDSFTADALREYSNTHDSSTLGNLIDMYPFFLIKGSAWKYEQEWRILVSKIQMDEPWNEGGVAEETEHPYQYAIYKQSIPFPYATKVFIGPKTPKEKKEHIIEICHQHSIKVYTTEPSCTKYALDYKEV